MNTRTSKLAFGLCAMLAPASAALAQGVSETADVTSPIINTNEEVFGPNTNISVTLPDVARGAAGVNAATNDTDAVTGFIVGLDADGNVLTVAAPLVITGDPNWDADNGQDGDDIVVDIAASGLTASFLNNANVTNWQLRFTKNGESATGAAVAQTDFDADEANDENLVLDNTSPELVSAFVSTDGETLFLTFSEALAAGTNTNDTDLGDVSAADFQINEMANMFDNATPNPSLPFTVAGAFTDAANTTIEVDISGMAPATTIDAGDFIRAVADDDGDPVAANDIFDVVGNQAFQQDAMGNAETTGVQISTVAALTIERVEVLATIDDTPGVTNNAIRVVYNLPLDAADLGDVDTGAGGFYPAFLTLNGMDSSIGIVDSGTGGANDPAVDPDNPNAVLLSVNQTGNDIVLADGLAGTSANNQYSVSVDTDGDVPSSIFGTNDYDTEQTGLAVEDGIDPAAQFFSFHDLDQDGVLDAVAVVFSEPITSSLTGAGGFTINVADAVDLMPASLIDELGNFPAMADLPESEMGTINPTSLVLGGVRIENDVDNDVTRLSTSNAAVLPFDPTMFDWTGDGAGMNAPGTNGPDSLLTLDHPAFTVTDTAGNELMVAAATGVNINRDRANPLLALAAFFTGDNQTGGSNDQFLVEQDGNVGDQSANDRLLLAFTEDTDAGEIDPESAVFGNGLSFDDDVFNTNQQTTFDDADGSSYEPGVQITFNSLDGDVVDDDGNPPLIVMALSNSGTVVDREAPYINLQNQGGVVESAFLVDTDDDGFANQALLQFTENIVQSDLSDDDFESFGANMGTITGVDTLTGTDNSIVVLSLTDGEISMASDAMFRYLGASIMADSLITGASSGNSVSAVNTEITAQEIAPVDGAPAAPATMLVNGTILGEDGVAGLPIGTSVYAAIAVPTVNSITLSKNGIDSMYMSDDAVYGQNLVEGSLEAFTNVLLGLRQFIYVFKNGDGDHEFSNRKPSDTGGSAGTIDLSVNANNLSNISFNGQGASNSDRAQGSLGLAWRLLATEDGDFAGLQRDGFDVDGEQIIFSETVISEANGRFEMAVTGPASAFQSSIFNTVGLPVIFWVELPDGRRFALSSLLTSATTNDHDGDSFVGDAIVFNPNNLRQESNNTASDATRLNFSLANVGVEPLFDNWNMVPFARALGVARSSRDIPTLPRGVVSSNVIVGELLAASPIDQFVYFDDINDDGEWTAADDDDSQFDSIIIDADTFKHFRFTLTTNGIRMGTGMNALVGGYAVAILNYSALEDLGVFQFGPALPGGSVFTANPITNSNASATQGWLLVTNTQEYDPATGFFTANPGSDYLINVANVNGLEDADAENSVGSLDPTATDANNNDIDVLPAGSAPFVHYVRP